MKNTIKIDRRITALALTVAAIAVIGFLITVAPSSDTGTPIALKNTIDSGENKQGRESPAAKEVAMRFKQGVSMLHAKRYEHAATAFNRVLTLSPTMPEAHVNMGFALIGMENYNGARDYFNQAITIRANQVNAYYGLAVALEGLSDLIGAIGAMESYIHLTREGDPYRTKAQAALWEWREALKREKSAKGEGTAKAAPKAGKGRE